MRRTLVRCHSRVAIVVGGMGSCGSPCCEREKKDGQVEDGGGAHDSISGSSSVLFRARVYIVTMDF